MIAHHELISGQTDQILVRYRFSGVLCFGRPLVKIMKHVRHVKNDDEDLRDKQGPFKPRSIRSDSGLLAGSGVIMRAKCKKSSKVV